MKAIKKEQMNLIAPLFQGIEDSMVIACLKGYMGNAYAKTLKTPKASLIVSGEYSFFGGDPHSDDAEYIVQHLFDVNQCENTIGIFSDDKPQWEQTLMSCPSNNPRAVPRFGIAQKDYKFDQKLLQGYIDSIPQGFSLVPFDEGIYQQAMAEDWSREFCETFSSAKDYLTKGFGFAALENGRLAAGASSMILSVKEEIDWTFLYTARRK